MNNTFALTTLAESPNYYNDVVKLIESEFNYEGDFHYDEDFKFLLEPSNHENSLLIIDKSKSKLVAHLAFVKRELIKDNFTLPIVIIGGIVTDKFYRGQNLFRTLINRAIEKNNSAALFMLWSDLVGMYEKFGFHLAGGILETGKNIITNSNTPDHYSKTKFNLLTEDEFNEIKSLYENQIEKKQFTVKRNNYHWSTIKSLSSPDLYIKKTEHGIESYFVLGKGKDIPGIIHEIAALKIKEELKALDQFKIWLPETNHGDYPNHQLNYMAFMKLGNTEALAQFLKKQILHFDLISNINGEVKFVFESKEYKCLEKEFLHYIFGPYPLEEFKNYKFSPYISGLDSV
jgi:predicted GNAT family N-acyltransferase